ncbi:hypothetical protein AB0F42_24255 [Streptomyces buecherae]|uniref:hypothetical protein n=1 Tax=Streptomyces buecherae TaxID=2763006 RepID=UPI0033F8CBF0
MDPSEKSLKARLAAHVSWSRTPDRRARTEAARRASHHTRFLDQARRENPAANDEQIQQIAASLRSAYFTALAIEGVRARRAKSKQRAEAKQKRIEAELRAAGRRPAA